MNHRKIKVTYIVSSLAKEGPVQVLYDIVSNIDYSIFEVSVITLKDESLISLKNMFLDLPINVICLKNISKYNLLNFIVKIKKHIVEKKVDIIHSHCLRSLLISYFLLKKVKSVHTVHNNPTLQSIALHGKIIGKITSKIIYFILSKIDVPVSCSESVRQQLEYSDIFSVRAIPNGIAQSIGNKDQKKTQKELNLDCNFKYFISVGRFSPEKNFELLVNAFLAANIPNTKLILLGDGKMMDAVKEISNENILLMGFKQNVSDYLAASDYYLSASLTEGMPLSVLEALAQGLPVALSDIPPHREILNKGGKFGFSFPVNNIQETTSIIKKLYNSNYNELKENAKLVFLEYFTAERMSTDYQNLYKKIIWEKY